MVATTDPARHLRVVLGPDQVVVGAADASDTADLTLTAEAFVRLVYGRLDPDHTPPSGTARSRRAARRLPGILRPGPRTRTVGTGRTAQPPTRSGRATANMARQPSTVTSVQDHAARGRSRRVVTITREAAPSVAAVNP